MPQTYLDSLMFEPHPKRTKTRTHAHTASSEDLHFLAFFSSSLSLPYKGCDIYSTDKSVTEKYIYLIKSDRVSRPSKYLKKTLGYHRVITCQKHSMISTPD